MRSGNTMNRPLGMARVGENMLNYDAKSRDVIPLINSGPQRGDHKLQIGLTSHNL